MPTPRACSPGLVRARVQGHPQFASRRRGAMPIARRVRLLPLARAHPGRSDLLPQLPFATKTIERHVVQPGTSTEASTKAASTADRPPTAPHPPHVALLWRDQRVAQAGFAAAHGPGGPTRHRPIALRDLAAGSSLSHPLWGATSAGSSGRTPPRGSCRGAASFSGRACTPRVARVRGQVVREAAPLSSTCQKSNPWPYGPSPLPSAA